MERLSTIVVKLPEVFGAKAARKLGREIKSKISGPDPHVVVDFSRVKRIDLRGLEALLKCLEELARLDGALHFGGLSPEAATLLELTRMDRVLQKFPGFSTDAPAFALSPEPAIEEVFAEGPEQLPVVA